MASVERKVFTAPLKGRQVDFYDSGQVYPGSHSVAVSPETAIAFTIPSSRVYYLGARGVRIPYLALSGPEQTRRDVAAWLERNDFPRVYSQGSVESSGDPVVDLISITEGYKVSVPARNLDEYLRRFGQMLDEYRASRTESERFGLISNRRMMEQMINYPFNPGTDFLLASRLANSPDRARIQQFLDERGVIHFSADDIVNLQPIDIFFYLTRFYGPPIEGDLNAKAIQRDYSRRATNDRAKEIARILPENIVTYRMSKQGFDLYFNLIVQNPNNPSILEGLGANNQDRLYRSFFDYLRLIYRRQGRLEGLPPLTLNTIKQLRPITEGSITGLLTDYTDQEIIELVGRGIDGEDTRSRLLSEAARLLLRTRVFVMQPYEARLCNNVESVYTADAFAELNYPFVGRGSFAAGFDCYTLQDLFSAWELNRDANGDVSFIDPLHPQATFRVSDLKEFRDALQAGRAQVPENWMRRFDDYIHLAETQSTGDYPKIRQLRQWAAQSPRNRELMRAYWTAYFQMGMYMRQWKGPGHPYPVETGATGRRVYMEQGTEAQQDLAFQISLNIRDAKVRLEEVVAQMPANIRALINDLEVVRRYQGQVESERVKIGERYNRVITQGDFCIREASAPWVYTGAYYFKQILNEQIPGFDLGTNVPYIN